MVRRRARTTKEALKAGVTSNFSNGVGVGEQHALMNGSGSNSDGVASAMAGANLLEDQYFASPKRKDCKLANANENLKMANIVVAAVAVEQQQQQQHRYKNSHNHHDHHQQQQQHIYNNNNVKIKTQTNNDAVAGGGKGKSERGGISGRNIGIPLATRSQTRTIENFFKANAAAKNAKLMTFNNEINEVEQKTISSSSSSSSPSPQSSPTPTQQLMMANKSPTPESVATDDIIDNNDDDDDDEDEEDLLPIHYIHDDDHEPTPSPPRFVLNGEDTNDTIYSVPESINHQATSNGFAILADFQTHRSSLRDSHSSHSSTATCDNIFLQEPVLKLDIDKSPNQASSIKINKSFEIGAVFSSPPGSGSLIAACMLNGRFNQIVTLNTNNSPTKRDSFGYECRPITPASIDTKAGASLSSIKGFVVDQDSSSCDSGVAFSANSLTPNGGSNNNSQTASSSPLIPTTRRRKPATPHRILCPSPIKTMPREHHVLTGLVPSARKVAVALKDPLSPRKSQRQLMNGGGSIKTRRRLNKTTNKEVIAPYPRNILADEDEAANTKQKIQIGLNDDEIVMINDDDDEYDEDVDDDGLVHVIDGDEEFENVTNMPPAALRHDLKATVNGVGIGDGVGGASNTKSILNSAKHPTARQNTTNNNSNINQINKTTANPIKSLTTTPNAILPTKPTQKSNKISGSGTKPKTKTTTNKNLNANGTTKIKSKAQQQPLSTLSNGNRELTEFFQVRRSVRKTKTVVKEEMMRNLEQAVLKGRAEGLKVAYFEKKGRGVIADRRFQRNEFVVEYVGDLISIQEAAEREKRYALDENAGCYMYYFKHKNQQYCIDATVDTGKLGRLVNHSRNGNLVTKVVVVKQRPHLVLLAKDDIEKGEELTYDYGDRSKESLLHHPWLAF